MIVVSGPSNRHSHYSSFQLRRALGAMTISTADLDTPKQVPGTYKNELTETDTITLDALGSGAANFAFLGYVKSNLLVTKPACFEFGATNNRTINQSHVDELAKCYQNQGVHHSEPGHGIPMRLNGGWIHTRTDLLEHIYDVPMADIQNPLELTQEGLEALELKNIIPEGGHHRSQAILKARKQMTERLEKINLQEKQGLDEIASEPLREEKKRLTHLLETTRYMMWALYDESECCVRVR